MSEENKTIEVQLDNLSDTPQGFDVDGKEPQPFDDDVSTIPDAVEVVSDGSIPFDNTQSQTESENFTPSPETILAALAEKLASLPDAKIVLEQFQKAIKVLTGEKESLSQQVNSLKQQLLEQTEQVDLAKKRYISIAAEFDNFRKRTNREKEDMEKLAKRKTLSELLTVIDNFERARLQIKPSNEGEMEIHKSYQGVYKSFVDNLKRLGVSAMRPEGEPFDPNYHEAVMREATDEYPEGTVIEQLIRGYLIEDQVLRHAMVKVATPKETDDEQLRSSEDPESLEVVN